MKKALLVLSLFIANFGMTQPEVYIHFLPKVGGTQIMPSDLSNTVYHDLSGVAFEVDAFKYYVSKLSLTHDGGQVINFDTANDVMLVSVANNSYNLGVQNITTLEQVDFGVGVHADFNHLDPNSYPIGHPLGNQQDPVMQWGWTAGYFHMALNSMGDNNTDDICDQMFQPHCLGDANFKTESLVMTGQLDGGSNIYHIYIDCNLDEWIFGADPGTFGVQHTDQAPIPAVMNNVDNRPVFTSSTSLGLNESNEIGNVFFTNSENSVKITWKEMKAMEFYSMIDMNGRVIQKRPVDGVNGIATVEGLKKGMYIFNCYNDQHKLIHSINVIH